MAKRTEGYVDTSALIAFADRSDTYHPLFRRLFSDAPALVTTTLVIAEGHGWFLKRYDATRALQFVGELKDYADAARALGLSRARVSQVANLLLLAPAIQEAILDLPPTTGRDPVTERQLRPLVAEPDWNTQLQMWRQIHG